MKNLSKLVFYSVLALLLAAIPAALLAADHEPGFGPGFGPKHGRGPGQGPGGHFQPGFMAELIADRLDLSEGQREQIRSIHESYRDETEQLMETMGVARLILRGRIHADAFDEAAIREAAGQVAAVEADLAVLRAKVTSEVHQVLTPEQVAEAQAMRERMREFADERHGRGRHHWGRGGFDGPQSDGE